MKRSVLFIFTYLLSALNILAANNWYVAPQASGSHTGTSWTNAWSPSQISWGSIAAGDFIWLSGGSYTQSIIVQASGTTGNPIHIYRVHLGDKIPTAAAGYNDGRDTQVKLSTANGPLLSFPSCHDVIVSGRITNGIKLTIPADGGDASTAATSGNVSNLTLTYLEIIGPGSTTGLRAGRYGVNWAPSNYTVTNILLDHLYVHQICEAFRASNWNTATIQHCNIFDLASDNIDHNDTIYSYPSKNVTWRYNRIYNSPDDGIFAEYGGQVNWSFYGNVVYNSIYAIIQNKAPGNYGPLYVYNNVFAGVNSTDRYAFISFDGTTNSSTQVYNNVFFNCANNSGIGGAVHSGYNAYYPAWLNGYIWPTGEAHSFSLSANPFVSSSTGNFHLTMAGRTALAKKGITLTANGYINTDPDGVLRGAGGSAWTVGAYQ